MAGGRSSNGGRGQGRKGKGFHRNTGMRPVDEATRININETLLNFQKSDATELIFPADLSNHDRAVVHQEGRKFGFKSKSRGKGKDRHVTLTKAAASRQVHEEVGSVPFCAASARVIQDYFHRFPAEVDGPDLQEHAKSPSGRELKGNKKRKLSSGASSFSPEEISSRQAKWMKRTQSSQMTDLMATRRALPIAHSRELIVDHVRESQVVLIAGETGCGKTTQVPQYLLEDAWGQGRGCRILCTQPRRISAVTISERVAVERGERSGENVGYTIRLESSGGPNCSLMFMTTGVLLRQLSSGDQLDEVTHIVVDEVHERDKHADFLLILLRDLLKKRPSLRLILMSATLHSELFSAYFDNCPTISVPGFTHPVHDVYLDKILPLIGYKPQGRFAEKPKEDLSTFPLQESTEKQLDNAIFEAFVSKDPLVLDRLVEAVTNPSGNAERDLAQLNHQHSKTGGTALMVVASKGRQDHVITLLTAGANATLKATNGMSAADWAEKFGHSAIAEHLHDHIAAEQTAKNAAENAVLLSRYQAVTDAEEVDLELIETLLAFLCQPSPENSNSTQGAILVFLPGWDEISKLKEKLEGSRIFSSDKFLILPLHSMVPAAEQRRVFVRPPAHRQKIILSTNIAETAVTIEDVTCVINGGRMKEKSYDCYTEVSTLMTTWVSKASEKQRRGRAGRCQPGVCFHLYSKQRSEALQEFQAPELQRTPLEEICLQVKLLGWASGRTIKLADFLSKAIEPPAATSVNNAVRLLGDIGALDPQTENLTLLGKNLAILPLPPTLGKMVLYSILFGTLDLLLTIACCMSYRAPWLIPSGFEGRKLAEAARAQLSVEAGGFSDHLAFALAYKKWAVALASGSEARCSASMHINNATMKMVHGMRSQILGELKELGLVTNLNEASRNAHQLGLVRAVLAASLYPQYGHVLQNKERFCRLQIASKEKIKIHGSSVNANVKLPPTEDPISPCRLLVFDEKTRHESQLYAMQTTLATPHILLLVASKVAQLDDESESEEEDEGESDDVTLLIDDWLPVRIHSYYVQYVLSLRRRLSKCFSAKVANPRAPLHDNHVQLLTAVGKVLRLEWEESGLDHSKKWTRKTSEQPQYRPNGSPSGGQGLPPPGFPGRGRAAQDSRDHGRDQQPQNQWGFGRGPSPGRHTRGRGNWRGGAPGRAIHRGRSYASDSSGQESWQGMTWQQASLLEGQKGGRGGQGGRGGRHHRGQ